MNTNIKILATICMGVFLSHSIAMAEETKIEIPESGPKISIETDDNFDDLGRSCDLENIQLDELAVAEVSSHKKVSSKEPGHCQKLLDADKKFQAQMKQAKCEALDTYVSTEREIRNCQINLRRSASLGETKIKQDIKNRDECIVKLQANFCQKSSVSSMGE